MIEVWISELLSGLWKLFIHPVFYITFLLAAFLGVSRVKKERSFFHVRAQNAYFELKQVVPIGLLLGIIGSIIILASGLVITLEFISFLAIITIFFSLFFRPRLLSTSLVYGTAFFLTTLAHQLDWELPTWLHSLDGVTSNYLTNMAILLALLLIIEGILIVKNGVKATSPQLKKSKRGQVIGVHQSSRIWLVPMFLLIPGDTLLSFADWWPVFEIGKETFSIIFVPFAIGFSQMVQGDLPKKIIREHGNKVILLGIATLILSIATYWWALGAIIVVALAVISRELIYLKIKLADESKSFFFSKRNEGVLILGILPQSPAEQMGLLPGEVVTKVNGIKVYDSTSFYAAVSSNRAQCKLEVLNVEGQVRFAQRSLYEGDHHELGILSVEKERRRKRLSS